MEEIDKIKLLQVSEDLHKNFKIFYDKFSEDKKESAIAKINNIVSLLGNYDEDKFKYIIKNLNISIGHIEKCKKQKTIKSTDQLFSDEIKRANSYIFDICILLG